MYVNFPISSPTSNPTRSNKSCADVIRGKVIFKSQLLFVFHSIPSSPKTDFCRGRIQQRCGQKQTNKMIKLIQFLIIFVTFHNVVVVSSAYTFTPRNAAKCPLFSTSTSSRRRYNYERTISSSSPYIGTTKQQQTHTHKNILRYLSNDDESSSEGETKLIKPDSSSSVASVTGTDLKTLFQKADEFFLNLKPKAIEAKNISKRSMEDEENPNVAARYMYGAKSCLYFTAFIFYRGYRGFFVILPAIFREVYRKMEIAFKSDDPFSSDSDDSISTDSDTGGKVRLRTTVTVSVLTGIVTLSYVLTGLYKVLAMFVGTIFRTSSVEPAFEAAVDELLSNEGKILKVAKSTKSNGSKATSKGFFLFNKNSQKLNGSSDGDELAP